MKKIIEGALFGLGFIGVAVSVVGILILVQARMSANQPANSERKIFKTVYDIEVSDTNVVIRDNRVVVLGKVTNPTESWMNIVVRVDLFGNESEFIDQCQTANTTTLRPYEEGFFKVICSATTDVALNQIGSQVAKVHDGHWR